MKSEVQLYLECAARLGIVIDEELHDKSRDPFFKNPLAEQVRRFITILGEVNDMVTLAMFIQAYATSAWQAGYRSAPKLEFVLPEGASG